MMLKLKLTLSWHLIWLYLSLVVSLKIRKWENSDNDQLITNGWDWHIINENFFQNTNLTRNVFETYVKKSLVIKNKQDILLNKIKSLDTKPTKWGYSLFVYADGGKEISIQYNIINTINRTDNLIKKKWIQIQNEFLIDKSSKFDYDLFSINFNVINMDFPIQKSAYIAISKLMRYFIIEKNNSTEKIFYNFTKSSQDYFVVKDEDEDDKENFWSNLNYPSLDLQNLAISRLNNYNISFEFNLSNTFQPNKSSICLKFNYFNDGQIVLQLKYKPKLALTQNLTQEFKYIDLNLVQAHPNENQHKFVAKWIYIQNCFYKSFLDENEIYLVSYLNSISQSGQFPNPTSAIADIKIERRIELIPNYLYSWSSNILSTSLFNSSIQNKNNPLNNYLNNLNSTLNVTKFQWYTSPVLDDFKLIQTSNQTYLELTNNVNTSTFVYYLISNSFFFKSPMRLSFYLINNHTEGSLMIYLMQSKLERQNVYKLNLAEQLQSSRSIGFDLNSSLSQNQSVFLIFEFKFNNLYNQLEYLKLSNFNLMDPCYYNHHQCKYGKCLSNSTNNWFCVCDLDAYGQYCQYFNMCKKKFDINYINYYHLSTNLSILNDSNRSLLNGDDYCAQRQALDCLPIGNRIICKCKEFFYWNFDLQKCVQVNACSFKYCPKNEICELNLQNQPICVCEPNFKRVFSQCVANYCDKFNCLDNQYCINDLIEQKAKCFCEFGFKFNQTNCEPLFADEDKLNPFILQYLGCQQAYKFNFDRNKYECTCLNGYELDTLDERSCKRKQFIESSCELRKISVKYKTSSSSKYQAQCVCRLGYKLNETICEDYFCKTNEKTNHLSNLLQFTCESGVCSENMVRRSKPIFQCSCSPDLFTTNQEKGFCELKNVCNLIEKKKCLQHNAYCVPRVIDSVLSPSCECSIGLFKDKQGNCAPLQEADYSNCRKLNLRSTYIDSYNYKKVCTCSTGHIFNNKTMVCELTTKNVVKLGLIVFLTHVNQTNWIPNEVELEHDLLQLNKSDNSFQKIFDCEQGFLWNKTQCFELTNEAYMQLIKIEPNLVDQNVAFYLYQNVRALIHYLVKDDGSDLANVALISFENLTKIDYDQQGFNTIYMVNISLISDTLKAASIQKQLDSFCFKNNFEPVNQNLKDFCFINQDILPVSQKLIQFKPSNLCELNLIKCPVYSSCIHQFKNNSNIYSCKCDVGFRSIHEIKQFNLTIEICEDVNECTDENLNKCGQNTECENLIGNFRCNCKDNFKRTNSTNCEATCTPNFPCVNGKCEVFEKNYEICICNDGYKGKDCSTIDSKVAFFKEILIYVIVSLNCLLVIVLIVSIYCIKRAKKKYLQEDQIDLSYLHNGKMQRN